MKNIITFLVIIGLFTGVIMAFNYVNHINHITATVNTVNSMQLPADLESD